MLAPPPNQEFLQDSVLALLMSSSPVMIALSCSQEAQEAKFDWSDFPMLRHSSLESSDTSPRKPLRRHLRESSSDSSIETASTASLSDDATTATNDSCCCSPAPPARHIKKVSFSNVLEIRTHAVTLGEHPCCPGGLALVSDPSLPCETEILDLDTYEEHSPKRKMRELRLDYGERRDRLMDCTGWTGGELLQEEFNLICGGGGTSKLHHTPSVMRALSSANNDC